MTLLEIYTKYFEISFTERVDMYRLDKNSVSRHAATQSFSFFKSFSFCFHFRLFVFVSRRHLYATFCIVYLDEVQFNVLPGESKKSLGVWRAVE